MPAAEDAQNDDASSGPGWRGGLVLTLAAVALVHSLVIGLWLAPSGPVRDAVGGSALGSYVDPYFRQSWDLLASSSQRVDETLWVRGRVRSGDEVTETPWLDVTGADLTQTRNDVAPARIHLAGRRLATNLNDAMFALGPAGRTAVRASYVGTPVEELRGVLVESGVSVDAARAYLNLDAMTTSFASLYTQAYAGEPTVQVQFRVGRRTVPPREDRDEKRISDVDFEWFDAGWRRAAQTSAEARAAFDSFVAAP